MHRLSLIIASGLLLVAACAASTYAQSVTNVKVGVFNPVDAKTGFIAGFTTGRQVDERVDFGLGVDFFIRRFVQESTVESGPPSTVQTELAYSMYALPIMVHLDFHVLPYAMVQPYIGLAGGYEILYSRETNYITDEKQYRYYGGFGWQVMIGAAYPLGSASSILGELLYNGCTVSRSKGESDLGFPVHEELDFSGLGFRIGLRF